MRLLKWQAAGVIPYDIRGVKIPHIGGPLWGTALLAKIAMGKIVLNWVKQKYSATVLFILLHVSVLPFNVLSWAFCRIVPTQQRMPIGCGLLLLKE